MSFRNSEKKPGRSGKSKGLTRLVDGHLEQRESKGLQWRPAIRHHDVRERLINDAAVLGHYKYLHTQGEDPLDVTSYLPKDREFGYERSQRPDILFEIRKRDKQDPHERNLMMLDGKVLLDQDDHEIIDWPSLPATISSQVSGQEIEFFRRQNLKMDYLDIIARMPRTYTPGKNQNYTPPSANVLNMRALRFRLQAGCISWTARQGTDKAASAMITLLGPVCEAENSSRAFGRDLNNQEIAEVRKPNLGFFPYRQRKSKRRNGGAALAKMQNTRRVLVHRKGKAMCSDDVVEDVEDDQEGFPGFEGGAGRNGDDRLEWEDEKDLRPEYDGPANDHLPSESIEGSIGTEHVRDDDNDRQNEVNFIDPYLLAGTDPLSTTSLESVLSDYTSPVLQWPFRPGAPLLNLFAHHTFSPDMDTSRLRLGQYVQHTDDATQLRIHRQRFLNGEDVVTDSPMFYPAVSLEAALSTTHAHGLPLWPYYAGVDERAEMRRNTICYIDPRAISLSSSALDSTEASSVLDSTEASSVLGSTEAATTVTTAAAAATTLKSTPSLNTATTNASKNTPKHQKSATLVDKTKKQVAQKSRSYPPISSGAVLTSTRTPMTLEVGLHTSNEDAQDLKQDVIPFNLTTTHDDKASLRRAASTSSIASDAVIAEGFATPITLQLAPSTTTLAAHTTKINKATSEIIDFIKTQDFGHSNLPTYDDKDSETSVKRKFETLDPADTNHDHEIVDHMERVTKRMRDSSKTSVHRSLEPSHSNKDFHHWVRGKKME